MRLIKVWEALGDIDQNEGRGGLRRIGVFSDETAAIAAARHAGVMGTPGQVRPRWAAVVNDGEVYVLEEQRVTVHTTHRSLVREAAFKKIAGILTAEEKAALGLRDEEAER